MSTKKHEMGNQVIRRDAEVRKIKFSQSIGSTFNPRFYFVPFVFFVDELWF